MSKACFSVGCYLIGAATAELAIEAMFSI